MKIRNFKSIALLGLTVVLLSSCSKLPQAEIDTANVAINAAKDMGADVYANESFIALQDSLNAVMVNIESQKSKFVKNYSSAKEQLAGVLLFAEEVKLEAEVQKEAVKVEVQNTIVEVKALIESNRKLILQAPKGKEGTTALVAIKGEIDAIETSVNECNALFENGDFMPASDKVKAAKEKAASIQDELSTVIAKYTGKARK